MDKELKPDAPIIPRKLKLIEVPSGEIRVEDGADGTYVQFDCDCLDALPYCRAQCCALRGTLVHPDEQEEMGYQVEWDDNLGLVLKRDADGRCTYLDRNTKQCSIYEMRPQVCQNFHCTRGADVRGWKLSNCVTRQSMN